MDSRDEAMSRHPSVNQDEAAILAKRTEAAKAARMLMDAARRGEGAEDVRTMIAAICSRLGHSDLIALADVEPDAVIDLWEGVELLNEGSFEAAFSREVPDAGGPELG